MSNPDTVGSSGHATAGLDVGGAHLKAAALDATGRVTAALQLPCRLWQGLGELETALAEAARVLGPLGPAAVTMTGELADIFADRATGVRAIVALLERELGPARYWAGRSRFVDAAGAASAPSDVGSANWQATASAVAARVEAGLLIDIGSTTTDLVPIEGGRARWRGYGDRQRLAAEELVYTGVTRTMLMALARDAPFRGVRLGLMNEYFASAADVWRVLGELPEGADQHETADGGAKTSEASARRLARMVGADLEEASMADWRRLAAVFARAQEDIIVRAAELQLSRGVLDEQAPVIGAGAGAFLVRRVAARLGTRFVAFEELIDAAPQAKALLATCAPAVSVALLAQASSA